MAFKAITELIMQPKLGGTAAFDRVEQRYRGMAKSGAKSAGMLGSAWAKVGIGLASVVGVAYSLKKALDFAKEGEIAANAAMAFRALNKDGQAAVAAIRGGLRGIIEETKAQQFVSKFTAMGFSVQQMGQLSSVAFKIWAATGKPAAEVMAQVATAAATGRTQTLANYGATKTAGDYQAIFAKQMGVSTDALDANQKQIAVLQGSLEELERKYGKIDPSKVKTTAHEATTAWADFVSDLQSGSATIAEESGKGLGVLDRSLKRATQSAIELMFQLRTGFEGANVSTAAGIAAHNRAIAAAQARAEAEISLQAETERLATIEKDRTKILADGGKVIADRALDEAALARAVTTHREALYALQSLELSDAGKKQWNQKLKESKAIIDDVADALRNGAHPSLAQLSTDQISAALATERFNEALAASGITTDRTNEKLAEHLKTLGKDVDLTGMSTNGLAEYKAKIAEARNALVSYVDKHELAGVAIGHVTAREKELKEAIDAAMVSAQQQEQAAQQAEVLSAAYETLGLRSQSATEKLSTMWTASQAPDSSLESVYGLYKQIWNVASAADASAVSIARMYLAATAGLAGKLKDAPKSRGARGPSDISAEEAANRLAILNANDDLERIELEHVERLRDIRDRYGRQKRARGIALLEEDARYREAATAGLQAAADAQKAILDQQAEHERLAREQQLRAQQELDAANAEATMMREQALRDHMQRNQEIISEYTGQMSDVGRALADMGHGFGSAIAESMYGAEKASIAMSNAMVMGGDAYKKSVPSAIAASGQMAGAFIENERARALVRALFEQGAAVASLVGGDFRGAALHQMAAGLFFYAAGKGGASAAAGVVSATPSQMQTPDQQGGGSVVNNVYLSGFAVGNAKELGNQLGGALNAAAGDVTLDSRLVRRVARTGF